MKALPKREQPSPSLIEGFLRRVRDLAWRNESETGDLKVALEELIEEVEEETGTAFSVEERELVKNALSFGELRVDDVMVPRADIKGIPAGSPLRAVIEAIRTGGHSRLVVFRETLDDIVGVIHIRDLLPYWGDGDTFSLEETMRPILVVPPSMRVIDLLLEMRATRNHLAVVVDEFGGTDGLVTIEDLVQEIVGEVQDEHDRVGRPRLTRNPDDSIDVDGRLYLEELEKELGFELLEEEDRDEADTVGGLIFTLLDRVPNRGEKVRHPSGVEFEILDADPRRIKRIRVRPTEASAGDVAEQQTG